jgi:hypothetical protein
MKKPPEKPEKQLSAGLIIILFIVSVVVGFVFIPYVNIFPTGVHDNVPDVIKPLMFGCFATALIFAGLSALFRR